ncbi:hypothetical protein DM860_001936 [Cuscuta australis]|uniref:Uncharacterized protein n=1 Tax=Cuscuta australis TaxID=267555 RepID=A0A328DVC8_9ASTE|nr:hypothetical protein DM860_001936 [Cuscuta australis]
MAEAALERKKDENASLKKLVANHEIKWKEYEAKMQCTEKMWQNHLTSIQTRLAEAKRRHAAAAAEHGSSRLSKTTSERIKLKPCADTHHSQIKSEQEVSHISPKDELAKLKLKFKAWTKDFKNRLHEAKTTMKKLGQPAKGKSSKIWCGR